MFNFGIEKLFGKNKIKKEESPVVQEIQQPVEEPHKTQTIEDVRKAKQDIMDLKSKKEEILNKLRDKKDEAYEEGVQQFKRDTEAMNLDKKSTSRKRTETFNDLMKDTEAELVQISKEIIDKQKEFSLEPSYVEVLEARRKRVEDVIGRIKNKFAPEYRTIQSNIISYLGESERVEKMTVHESTTLNNFRQYVLETNVSIPEVADFYEKVKGLRFYEEDGLASFKKEFNEFRKIIKDKIKENTVYKTIAEEKEAEIQIQRGVSLHDEITKLLNDARKKEGKFEPQNSKYF